MKSEQTSKFITIPLHQQLIVIFPNENVAIRSFSRFFFLQCHKIQSNIRCTWRNLDCFFRYQCIYVGHLLTSSSIGFSILVYNPLFSSTYHIDYKTISECFQTYVNFTMLNFWSFNFFSLLLRWILITRTWLGLTYFWSNSFENDLILLFEDQNFNKLVHQLTHRNILNLIISHVDSLSSSVATVSISDHFTVN